MFYNLTNLHCAYCGADNGPAARLDLNVGCVYIVCHFCVAISIAINTWPFCRQFDRDDLECLRQFDFEHSDTTNAIKKCQNEVIARARLIG